MTLFGRTVKNRWQIAVLVTAALLIVHSTGAGFIVEVFAADSKSDIKPKTSPALPTNAVPQAARSADMPSLVAEMREAILAAVQSGNIEDLKTPLEWNEMRPIISDKDVSDPIAHWKGLSGDGQGREILAVLGRILDMGFAKEPLGKDVENSAIYVWPYLATLDLDKLTPAQEVDLYRLMPPAEAKAMREKKKWTWWRLSIGADGTWHTFMKAE